MRRIFRIAIDGPGGAGKSTAAKKIAEALNIEYVDTGAMYRAVAYKMKECGVGLKDETALTGMLTDTDIDFLNGDIVLDGRAVNDFIRTAEISKLASDCSALAPVREKLVVLQREMGRKKSIVMDGRDIGTNVIKDAEFKFFMTATIEERAKRRYDELILKGQDASYESVLSDMSSRDRNDMTRALNPLKKADDAVELDTTEMTIEEVCEFMLRKIREGGYGDNKAV